MTAGPVSDKIGRKPVILIADVFFTIGSFMMYLSHSIPTLMIARIIVGIGVGLASLIVPVYLSEISPIEVRGTVVAVDVMLITGG